MVFGPSEGACFLGGQLRSGSPKAIPWWKCPISEAKAWRIFDPRMDLEVVGKLGMVRV